MKYNQLGRSGLRVSALSFGTMTFGGTGWASTIGHTDIRSAANQIAICADAGINLIDTADVYSSGLSEEILGEAIGSHRDDMLVATKLRMPMGEGPNDAGLSRHHIIRSCEASLRRLQTDHIDLYQVHEWDGQTPLEETLRALDALVQSGKVRYIGASNFTAWQLMKGLGTSERLGLERFASHQIFYSLHAREVEYELVPASLDQGVGILVWSPLAGGLLSGKYGRGKPLPEGARHTLNWGDPPIHDEDRLYSTIDAVVSIANAHAVSASQVAIAWLLSRPGVTSVVIGARSDQQLIENLGSLDVVLSDDEIALLERVSSLPLYYPYWHQAETASDRLSEADLSLLGRYVPWPGSAARTADLVALPAGED
jgi:aryl-alcohol dehydrogenase-like predicted oxidoreductase